MKKIILSLLFILPGMICFCATWTITNSGNTFTPATITINNGDSVNFSIASIHEVAEVSQATWNANGNTPLPGFSTPFGGGLVLPVQLTPGTHYYVCVIHASMGMKGIITVKNPAGIFENQSKENISIFPNPSNGKFKLEINNTQPVKNYNLEIYNEQGYKVYSLSDFNLKNPYEINLSDFPKGIYFVKICEESEIYYRKIVVQ